MIKPTEDRILVERLDCDEKTKGGIIIPDTAKEKPMYGIVVAVGPGRKNDKGEIITISLKVGDKILFAKWSGTEIKCSKTCKELLIMKESDVLAVYEGECSSSAKTGDHSDHHCKSC